MFSEIVKIKTVKPLHNIIWYRRWSRATLPRILHNPIFFHWVSRNSQRFLSEELRSLSVNAFLSRDSIKSRACTAFDNQWPLDVIVPIVAAHSLRFKFSRRLSPDSFSTNAALKPIFDSFFCDFFVFQRFKLLNFLISNYDSCCNRYLLSLQAAHVE